MNPSDELKAFTKKSESLQLEAYPDTDGYSIGYGFHDASITKGTVWTKEQAEEAFEKKMAAAAAFIDSQIHVPLTQGQKDCLCDLAYNAKWTSLKGSQLFASINAGNLSSVPHQLYHVDEDGTEHGWIFSGGKVNHGLVNRRKGEIEFWEKA